MHRRVAEIVLYLLLGALALWLGASWASKQLAPFFYLMAAMFLLAMFRPWKLP
ncbi:MAG: hypothetical protein HYY96_12865 [Candidatus Tectomicrobia bacterium]|nr:hypothetical protein [Candidatus Tectomicrobia bacterium]